MVKTVRYDRRLTSQELFNEAKEYIPGGVNSPVRSFKAVGGYPVFVNRAKGSKLYGECGEEFVDYCLSWGALILGHAYPMVTENLRQAVRRGTSFGTVTKAETELAKLIVEAIPSIEQVRLTNSGTEAVMSAIRLARAYTGRNKIIKFEGSYHGHVDYLLAKSGSGLTALGMPDSLGVPKAFAKHTITLPYNDLRRVEEAVKRYFNKIAAIIVEPVVANCGVILPQKGFLQGLKKIADKFNIILIFDEVITGFRLSYGGAQEMFNIKPNLTCLGKVIGGGLPIGAFGGKKEIMRLLAPGGGVYQAGTLSGNPIAVTAGKVTLDVLKKSQPYSTLAERTKDLCEGIKKKAQENGVDTRVNYTGTIFSIFFTNKEVKDYKTAMTQDMQLFKKFFHGLLKDGIYLSPSGFEANFLSMEHTTTDIERTLKSITKIFKKI